MCCVILQYVCISRELFSDWELWLTETTPASLQDVYVSSLLTGPVLEILMFGEPYRTDISQSSILNMILSIPFDLEVVFFSTQYVPLDAWSRPVNSLPWYMILSTMALY